MTFFGTKTIDEITIDEIINTSSDIKQIMQTLSMNTQLLNINLVRFQAEVDLHFKTLLPLQHSTKSHKLENTDLFESWKNDCLIPIS